MSNKYSGTSFFPPTLSDTFPRLRVAHRQSGGRTFHMGLNTDYDIKTVCTFTACSHWLIQHSRSICLFTIKTVVDMKAEFLGDIYTHLTAHVIKVMLSTRYVCEIYIERIVWWMHFNLKLWLWPVDDRSYETMEKNKLSFIFRLTLVLQQLFKKKLESIFTVCMRHDRISHIWFSSLFSCSLTHPLYRSRSASALWSRHELGTVAIVAHLHMVLFVIWGYE